MEHADAELAAAVERFSDLVDETIAFIHAHPELAHEEYACAGFLGQRLRGLGFAVEAPLAGLETAFRATLEGGRPGRTVALTTLYDAVPWVPAEGGIAPVHSCGHGPIAGGVMGAAAALAEQRENLPGRIVVMGCPADEIHAPGTVARGGGKLLTAAAGAWDGVDAALYAHPEPIDTAWTTSLWMRRDTAIVAGARDVAPGAAQPVLDAVADAVRAVRGLPAGRAMLEHLEMDGDVEDGGGMVARATVLLWSEDEAGLDRLARELREALPARWSAGRTVPSIAPDPGVRAAVEAALKAAGRDPVADPPTLPFATDFGAVTRVVPSALVGVAGSGDWAYHTPIGEGQFASDAGNGVARGIATVLALASRRLLVSA